MGSNAKGRTEMEVGDDGVAIITIINPPVNALSFDGTLFHHHLLLLLSNLYFY